MNVKITDIDGKKPSFTQWDVDRVLLISGVDSQPALHFANHELRRAIVVLAEEEGDHWTCKVPNFVLQFAGPMAVSVFLQPDNDEGKTVYTSVYNVMPKMKPQDYNYTENIGYINWVVKSEEVQNLIDTIQTMLDNGELKGDTGPGASVEVTEDTDFILVHGQYQNMRDKHVVDIQDNTGSHTFTVRDPYPLKLISNKSDGKTSLWFYTDDFFPVVEINDGEPPAVSVEETYYGNKVTFTDGTGPHTINVLDGMTDAVKAALLDLFQHVAYIDGNGQQYYDALYDAFNPVLNVEYITVAFDPGTAVIYNTYELAQLKPYLTVTAHFDDDTTAVVNDYTLSGTLATGTSAITATYGGKSAIFTVNVVEWLTGITAVFSQGSATIYDTDSLDTLKQYLVVTATYSDSTTETISNYTLSGTLSHEITTVNALANNTWTDGIAFDGNGNQISRPTLACSDFIQVEPGMQYEYTKPTNVGSKKDVYGMVVYLYDANKGWLGSENSSGVQDGSVFKKVFVPDTGVGYVRLMSYLDVKTYAEFTYKTPNAWVSTITASYGGKTDTFNVNVRVPRYLVSGDIESNIGTGFTVNAGTITTSSPQDFYIVSLDPSIRRIKGLSVNKFSSQYTTMFKHAPAYIFMKDSNDQFFGIKPGTSGNPTDPADPSAIYQFTEGSSKYNTPVVVDGVGTFSPVLWNTLFETNVWDFDANFDVSITSEGIIVKNLDTSQTASVEGSGYNRIGFWGSSYMDTIWLKNIMV